jgi:hypothetical protein
MAALWEPAERGGGRACAQRAGRPAPVQERGVARPVPATGDGSATATDSHALPNAELVKQGYRVITRGRQLFYCRSQIQTGSLISSTVCLTEDQLRTLEQNTKQSKDLLSQPRGGRNCPRGDCSNNGG